VEVWVEICTTRTAFFSVKCRCLVMANNNIPKMPVSGVVWSGHLFPRGAREPFSVSSESQHFPGRHFQE
jgi:hypothetical protein